MDRASLPTPQLMMLMDAYLWHRRPSFESSSNTVINPLGFPPVFWHAFEAVTLMAFEYMGPWECRVSEGHFSVSPAETAKICVFYSCSGDPGDRSEWWYGWIDVRFFTIGTCFFADTICSQIRIGLK